MDQEEVETELRKYSKTKTVLEQQLKLVTSQEEHIKSNKEYEKMILDVLDGWTQDIAAIEAANDRESMRNLIQVFVREMIVTMGAPEKKDIPFRIKPYSIKTSFRFGASILQGKDMKLSSDAVYNAFLKD